MKVHVLIVVVVLLAVAVEAREIMDANKAAEMASRN